MLLLQMRIGVDFDFGLSTFDGSGRSHHVPRVSFTE